MKKTIVQSLCLAGTGLSSILLSGVAQAQALPPQASPTANNAQVAYDQNYNSYSQFLNQVNSISQLRDVSPQGWSYEALRNLVENYGCIVGYPDRTYRGNQALSRNEFAAGLNACLTQLERRLLDAQQQLALQNPGTAQRVRQSVQPGDIIPDVMNRAFYNSTGRYYDITSISGQANKIFGWRTFPGSFFDNQIASDAETVEAVYNEVMRQQQEGTDIRTRDLPNPFNTSLQGNPGYLRLGGPMPGFQPFPVGY
ncbi:probable porin; major outer membrane protein [Synechocystis sp. LKSZ1]